MAARERLFFTGSTRIISDPRPSGLDMRVYACVSLHDGMSLLKNSGRGCYATFATMTAEIGCDAANLSRSLKRLVEWGYLKEERQEDRRRKTYRVTFDDAETWRNRQQSIVVDTTKKPVEIVGNRDIENRGNLPLGDKHYSSSKGLDLPKDELNSPEGARSVARQAGKVQFHHNVAAQLAKLDRDLSSGAQIDLVAAYKFVCDAWAREEHRPCAWRLSDVLLARMTPEQVKQLTGP